MPDAVSAAFAQGRAALAEGDLPRARDLLEYAHRREPEDGRIALTLACARMRRRDASALDLLRQVAGRHGVREAWHSLAVFGLQDGPRPNRPHPTWRSSSPASAPLDRGAGQLRRHRPPGRRRRLVGGQRRWHADRVAAPLPARRRRELAADLAIDLDGRPLEARRPPARAGAQVAGCRPAGSRGTG